VNNMAMKIAVRRRAITTLNLLTLNGQLIYCLLSKP
jgi:hypothetical protein